MSHTEIMEKLQDIFRDIFAQDALIVHENTDASDIEEWDSLMHISILAAVQDEFSVNFDMGEIIAMKNIGDIVRAIESKKGE